MKILVRVKLYLFICLFSFYSCKKISDNPGSESEKVSVPGTSDHYSRGGEIFNLTNQTLLKLVLNGRGGTIQVDSTCSGCPGDTSDLVEFPQFIPPSNNNGMLVFATMNDYNLFIKAADLMEELWQYPDIDYEDTPLEIYHLGEESLNAFDSAMNFKSLRHRYDLNEFYNHEWSDTAAIYVEDEDYQVVLNEGGEVKIGDKFYKYIANNLAGIVRNNNSNALKRLRENGIFTNTPDVSFYNEDNQEFVTPAGPGETEVTHSCSDFTPISAANNLTPISSTANQWEVELNTDVFYTRTSSQIGDDYRHVKANYRVDWGDGTITNFVGYFVYQNRVRHIYSQVLAPGTSVQKTITITCQVINPDPVFVNTCGSIGAMIFTSTAIVTLSTPATQDCLNKTIKRKFFGKSQPVNGIEYRLECKLKQKISPVIGESHVKATAIFTKRKNNKWKTVISIGNIGLKLKGDVFKEQTCSELHKHLNDSDSKNKRRKIKLKTGGGDLPWYFDTRRSLPLAINADFIWKYNNNQSVVSNNNEVLKP